MQRKLAMMLAAVALMLALAACGGKNDDSAGNNAPSESASQAAASEELVIKATSWEFDKAEYEIAKDTPVKITVENQKGAHGIEIVGTGVKIRGDDSDVVTLAAGTYEIKCSLMCGNGHAGMKTKLVVK